MTECPLTPDETQLLLSTPTAGSMAMVLSQGGNIKKGEVR